MLITTCRERGCPRITAGSSPAPTTDVPGDHPPALPAFWLCVSLQTWLVVKLTFLPTKPSRRVLSVTLPHTEKCLSRVRVCEYLLKGFGGPADRQVVRIINLKSKGRNDVRSQVYFWCHTVLRCPSVVLPPFLGLRRWCLRLSEFPRPAWRSRSPAQRPRHAHAPGMSVRGLGSPGSSPSVCRRRGGPKK